MVALATDRIGSIPQSPLRKVADTGERYNMVRGRPVLCRPYAAPRITAEIPLPPRPTYATRGEQYADRLDRGLLRLYWTDHGYPAGHRDVIDLLAGQYEAWVMAAEYVHAAGYSWDVSCDVARREREDAESVIDMTQPGSDERADVIHAIQCNGVEADHLPPRLSREDRESIIEQIISLNGDAVVARLMSDERLEDYQAKLAELWWNVERGKRDAARV